MFGGLAIFNLIRSPGLGQFRAAVKERCAVILERPRASVYFSRKPPLSTVELEINLKTNLSLPFAGFKQDEWDWFWQLLYGRFSVDAPGWPKEKRQLDREEVQDRLIEYYPQPFAAFNEEHWSIFWRHILKGRVF